MAFWVFIIFMAVSIILLLSGQTMSVFYYDLTVQFGLQESYQQVSAYGVQVNRAFGASDTVIYIPLMLISIIGLIQKKHWALITTGAVAGASAYWAATTLFMFLFLPGTAGYKYVPAADIWGFVLSFIIFGLWGLLYLSLRGKKLMD